MIFQFLNALWLWLYHTLFIWSKILSPVFPCVPNINLRMPIMEKNIRNNNERYLFTLWNVNQAVNQYICQEFKSDYLLIW